eukprot:COSAG02_NODE_5400_length_4362_cov_3.969505_4_plen_165_part_00
MADQRDSVQAGAETRCRPPLQPGVQIGSLTLSAPCVPQVCCAGHYGQCAVHRGAGRRIQLRPVRAQPAPRADRLEGAEPAEDGDHHRGRCVQGERDTDATLARRAHTPETRASARGAVVPPCAGRRGARRRHARHERHCCSGQELRENSLHRGEHLLLRCGYRS